MEEWRDVPGYEGYYQASRHGEIRNKRTGRILKPFENKYGYLQVTLCKCKKKYLALVSRCVWSAFNGPIPEGMQVNHISERKCENKLENLNLMNSKENNNWGTRNERAAKTMSKQVFQYDTLGNLIKVWNSLRGIEKETGYSRGSLSDCCKGKLKTAYGYVWRYAE